MAVSCMCLKPYNMLKLHSKLTNFMLNTFKVINTFILLSITSPEFQLTSPDCDVT